MSETHEEEISAILRPDIMDAYERENHIIEQFDQFIAYSESNPDHDYSQDMLRTPWQQPGQGQQGFQGLYDASQQKMLAQLAQRDERQIGSLSETEFKDLLRETITEAVSDIVLTLTQEQEQTPQPETTIQQDIGQLIATMNPEDIKEVLQQFINDSTQQEQVAEHDSPTADRE